MVIRFFGYILMMNFIVNASSAFAYDKDFAESSKCSRYFALYEDSFGMPNNIMRAIGITESGKYVKSVNRSMAWPWTINAKGKGYYFSSKREAIKAVQKLRDKGVKSIDVGCMQINLMYHPNAFHSLEQAFEPKYNIRYAAKFLREKYMQVRNWKNAVGLYHNGNPRVNRRYIRQVYRAWRGTGEITHILLLGSSFSRQNSLKKIDKEFSMITKKMLISLEQ